MKRPPTTDSQQIREWADYVFSLSSDESWLDAASFRRIMFSFANEIDGIPENLNPKCYEL